MKEEDEEGEEEEEEEEEWPRILRDFLAGEGPSDKVSEEPSEKPDPNRQESWLTTTARKLIGYHGNKDVGKNVWGNDIVWNESSRKKLFFIKEWKTKNRLGNFLMIWYLNVQI